MKTNLITIIAIAAIFASCSSTKKMTSKNTEDTTVQMNSVENESTINAAERNESIMTQNNIATQVNGSTGAMSNTGVQNNSKNSSNEYSKMYTTLEMSDDQISAFTSAMNRFKTKQAKTASGEMLGSIESERTRQMESILSSAQYAKYEQWLIDNQ